jgi:predicted amino acid-binding ACT domain protein
VSSLAKFKPSFILTLTGRNTVGIVAAVTTTLAQHGGLITEGHHSLATQFCVLRLKAVIWHRFKLNRFSRDFTAVVDKCQMIRKRHDAAVKLRRWHYRNRVIA